MSLVNEQAVETVVANLIGETFGVGNVFGESAETEPAPEKFVFDQEFQARIVHLVATDQVFMRKVAHLIRADYFELEHHSAFVHLALAHWKKYEAVLGTFAVMKQALQSAVSDRSVNKEGAKAALQGAIGIRDAITRARTEEVHGLNADFVADKVAEFVRQQAVINAVHKSVELIDKGDYAKIEKLVSDAVRIGAEANEAGGDYFERIKQRTLERAEESVGKRAPRGITTGHPKIDGLLYHRGWGRKELSVLMGGAKAGKTTALVEFSAGAVMAGFNVLYVTLEVSNRIIEERADSRFTEVPIADLVGHFGTVNKRVEEMVAHATAERPLGRFYITEFPSGTMNPAALRALLERHKAKGWTYDMVVVDYADIMAPDYRTSDPIENSKQIYIGLRAIAQEWNVALLTATQSNREGYKAVTAKAEHVSEDFNKVRTADLFISINSTEEERRDGKARLHFAASRNQRSGMTIFIEQDFNRMKFIKAIERVE